MMSLWKKGLTLTLCFLEITLLGGALFGWPSLVYVLQADGLYFDECLKGHDTVLYSARNDSLPLRIFPYNATVRQSFGSVIDFRSIKHSSTSYLSADEGTVITGDVNRNDSETMVNTDGDEESNSNYTVTVTSHIDIRCKQQKLALSLSYTIATMSYGVFALPIGLFFDRFGLRATRTIAVLLAVAGYCQLAFAKRGMEWPILTGAVFIGATCYTLIITNWHVTRLAGKRISLMAAIYAAGLNSSFAYQLVKMAHDAGVTRLVALLTLASLWLVVLFTSWCLLPNFKIDDKKLGIGKHSFFASFTLNFGTIAEVKVAPNVGGVPKKEQSLWRYITSATYITFVLWFCADYTCYNMQINGYNAWITDIVHGDLKKVKFYTDLQAYGILAGSLLTPVNGLITDLMLVKYGRGPGGKSLAMLPAALLSSIFMTLVNIPLLFHTEAAIYAVGVLFAIGKPLFISVYAIFMSVVAPMQYYGVLYGLRNLFGGVASFMVYPYLMWTASAHSFIPVTILTLASSVLAFMFPLTLYYDRWAEVRRKEKSKNKRHLQQTATKPQKNTTGLQQNTTKPQQNET